MTHQKSVLKTALHYISLNILSTLGLSLYILADTYFIANGVGSDGLVALNIAIPAFSFVNGFGLLLGVGGATVFSIAQGGGDEKRGSRVFSQILLIGLAAGTLFSLTGLFFSRPMARLLGAHPGILPLTAQYIQAVIGFSLAFVINNILIAFVRNDKNPKLAMAAMLTGSLSNILLDYILVYPMGLGMLGAALATGIAPLISLCILSLHRLKGKNGFHFHLPPFSKKDLLQAAGSGLPSFVIELSGGVVILAFNMILLSLSGDTAVAAYGIITNVALVCISIFNGIGQGIQPVISRCYGAREQKSLKTALVCGGLLSLICGVLLTLVGQIFPKPIIAAFNQSNDSVLASMALEGFRVYFFSFLFAGVSIVLTSYFAAISKPLPSLAISLLRGIAAVIPLALILPRFFGLLGVWAAPPAAEAITLGIGLFWYALHSKKEG